MSQSPDEEWRGGVARVIAKRYDGSTEGLRRYQREMDENPELLVELVQTPDAFESSIPVFTYDEDCRVVQKLCERLGWPNVTHDGELMYENMFFVERAKAVEAARRNALAAIQTTERRVQEMELEIQDHRNALARHRAALSELPPDP